MTARNTQSRRSGPESGEQLAADGGDPGITVRGGVAERGHQPLLFVPGAGRDITDRLFGRRRGRHLQQRVEAPRGLPMGDTALVQQFQHRLHQGEIVRPRWPGHQRGLGQARMGEQHAGIGPQHLKQPFLPVAPARRGGPAS